MERTEKEVQEGARRAVEQFEINGRNYRRKGRPLNAPILNIEPGQSAFGQFGGIKPLLDRMGAPVAGKFGPLEFFEITDPETGEVTQYWSGGGIRGAVAMSKINPGDLVEIHNTGRTKPHPEWNTEMPIFEIYALDNPN